MRAHWLQALLILNHWSLKSSSWPFFGNFVKSVSQQLVIAQRCYKCLQATWIQVITLETRSVGSGNVRWSLGNRGIIVLMTSRVRCRIFRFRHARFCIKGGWAPFLTTSNFFSFLDQIFLSWSQTELNASLSMMSSSRNAPKMIALMNTASTSLRNS